MFIVFHSQYSVPKINTELDKFNVFIYTKVKQYFKLFLNELHFGLSFLSNDAKILVYGSKLTDNVWSLFKFSLWKIYRTWLTGGGGLLFL